MKTTIEIWKSKKDYENRNKSNDKPMFHKTYNNFTWFEDQMKEHKIAVIDIATLCMLNAQAYRDLKEDEFKDDMNLKDYSDTMWDILWNGTLGIVPREGICVIKEHK